MLDLDVSLLYNRKVSKTQPSFKLFFLVGFFCFDIWLSAFKTKEIVEVKVGTKRLWDLLKTIRIRDAHNIPRSWSNYFCKISQGTGTRANPMCPGDHHSCKLASLVFDQFSKLYAHPGESGKPPTKFPSWTMHTDNLDYLLGVVDEPHRGHVVKTILDQMKSYSEKKHHVMWLFEIQPDHAFIVEQGPSISGSTDFRLYQSWKYGFDVNYWVDEAKIDQPCLEWNWGKFGDMSYSPDMDISAAFEHDMLVLSQAKKRYGGHKTFDEDTFKEIVTKLSFGFPLLEEVRMKQQDVYDPHQYFDLTINRYKWSLAHIFGLEPVGLLNFPGGFKQAYYGITVKTLDLGTTSMMAQIVSIPEELERMNEGRIEDITDLNPMPPMDRPKRIVPKPLESPFVQEMAIMPEKPPVEHPKGNFPKRPEDPFLTEIQSISGTPETPPKPPEEPFLPEIPVIPDPPKKR